MGVDTHKDVHVAVAHDGLGRRLGTLSVPTSPVGYKELVDWASGFVPPGCAGVEGTGSFGCGLARFLQAKGIEVFEVIRPRRRDQYCSGKSDPIDAEAAAGAVLAGTHPEVYEQIAEAAVWLCSGAASFVTGHAMTADGGYVAQ